MCYFVLVDLSSSQHFERILARRKDHCTEAIVTPVDFNPSSVLSCPRAPKRDPTELLRALQPLAQHRRTGASRFPTLHQVREPSPRWQAGYNHLRPQRARHFSTPMECAYLGGLMRLTGLPKRESVPRENISNAESTPGDGNNKLRPDTDAFYFHQ